MRGEVDSFHRFATFKSFIGYDGYAVGEGYCWYEDTIFEGIGRDNAVRDYSVGNIDWEGELADSVA
jgi:hypothetical protein